MNRSLAAACLAVATTLWAGLASAIPSDLSAPDPDKAPGRERLVSLASGVIDAADPGPVPESLAAGAAGSSYAIVKFPGPVSAEQLRALHGAVENVYTYLPYDAFLVRRKSSEAAADLTATGARWVLPYHPAYKLGPAIAGVRAAAGKLSPSASKPLVVAIQAYPDADLGRLRRRLGNLGLGAEVVGMAEGRRFSRLRLLLTPEQVELQREALAQLPEVFWVDLEPRRVLLNDTTIWVSQAGTAGAGLTPVFDRGILGEGQIVGVLDTGIDADMCYFRDPSLGLPPRNECNGGTTVDLAQRKVIAVDFLWSTECSGGISGSEWDTQDHGSHVAGTVAGDNLANPLVHDPGDGIAPGAKLVVQDCGYQTDNCADCPGIGCPVVDLKPIFQQAFDQGARMHTNSWGDEENNPVKGRYTSGSQDADEFMWNHPDFLLLFAAGNDGPGTGTVGSPSTAKNVVSVGATLRASSAESMASFSSCGPTDDGRIKPDVTMPGSNIISANADRSVTSNNCSTKSSSGTSMASPGAAGAAALIRQYYTDGWYPTGDPVPGDAFVPSAALLKATLLNSAVNMTGTAAIPANCQGWGRVLLDDALFFGGESRELFVEDDRTGFAAGSAGAVRTFPVTVGSSLEPLKVTLTWTDFPSTPAASPHINNDLDLEVSGPSGTFRGNVFSGGVSTTGGSADRLNSVEQVLLATPQAGTYTVTVRAFNVPDGPQPFALVVTGALTAACSPAPVADAGPDRSLCPGDSATLGTTAQSGHTYSWSPGGQTTAQINVSPSTTTTYTLTATTSCGSAQDSATVTVGSTTSGGLDTDFEGSTTGWTTSGLWHLTDGSSCASPGYSSPTHAFYYGQDSGCTYSTGSGTSGDLISPEVMGITASSTLSFDYYRVVESYSGAYDRTEVAVSTNGGTSWSTVWSRDSSNASTAAWASSGSISLASFAGQAIRVRFRFDSVDGSYNSFTGWFIDDVVITGEASCGGDPPPGGECTTTDFTSGASGWTNSSASTCSTGAFVAAVPTSVVNGGVTTQVGGDHTTGGGNAFFTATNSSAGVNDVDGGTCIAESGNTAVTEASTLSVWYFHGQRDAGGDAGDFFRLELSLDGGSSWSTLASYGDVTVNAAWTEATASIPAGSTVRLRVQAADGTTGGDLIEGGVDDVSICPVAAIGSHTR